MTTENLIWPITVEKLEEFEAPIIVRPAAGIVAITAGYDNTTIDLTESQAQELYDSLGELLSVIDGVR